MHCSANVGAERRQRDPVRALRHRQDDAVGRPRPPADRRRRARLDRGRHLQLRGRLLRQADRPRQGGRAGHRRGALDAGHDHRERAAAGRQGAGGDRPAGARPDRRLDHREHALRLPARLQPERRRGRRGPHPETIVLLTADAFGVLPPVVDPRHRRRSCTTSSPASPPSSPAPRSASPSRRPTFSPASARRSCRSKPSVYAELLADRMEKHQARCVLLNTGWSGGPYGIGKRISIKYTRALLNAALDGTTRRRPDRAARDLRPDDARPSARASPPRSSTRATPGRTRRPTTTAATKLRDMFRKNYEDKGFAALGIDDKL